MFTGFTPAAPCVRFRVAARRPSSAPMEQLGPLGWPGGRPADRHQSRLRSPGRRGAIALRWRRAYPRRAESGGVRPVALAGHLDTGQHHTSSLRGGWLAQGLWRSARVAGAASRPAAAGAGGGAGAAAAAAAAGGARTARERRHPAAHRLRRAQRGRGRAGRGRGRARAGAEAAHGHRVGARGRAPGRAACLSAIHNNTQFHRSPRGSTAYGDPSGRRPALGSLGVAGGCGGEYAAGVIEPVARARSRSLALARSRSLALARARSRSLARARSLLGCLRSLRWTSPWRAPLESSPHL